MEQQNSPVPEQNWDFPPQEPLAPVQPFFPSGKREFAFGLLLLIFGWLLCNSVFFGGFHLGFSIFSSAGLLCAVLYLILSGKRPSGYALSLLALSLLIIAGFARSDDWFVKFVLFWFAVAGSNLGLCLLAGQNRRSPAYFSSLADIFRTVFMLGLGQLPSAFRGLSLGLRSEGNKKAGAVIVGLLIAVPILAVLLPLLTSADAAFDALVDLLPQWEWQELAVSVLFGSMLAVFFYTRATALCHTPKSPAPEPTQRKGIPTLTVHTALIAICFVYCVYLVSQLAYFVGGFSGILPENYTLAEYARRGFFEMAWLCAINLAIICLSTGLIRKRNALTRLSCLFLGVMTLFLVCTASAKMFLYIDAYGLTRLRILTEVIMVWLALVTVFVIIWLFAPKMPYMKAVFLSAMLLGSLVLWADVDTVVARYNVNAYQTGKLATVDVDYLASLGHGVVPYLSQLSEDADPDIAKVAQDKLENRWWFNPNDDFRDWNYVNHTAEKYLPKEEAEELP